MRQINTFIQKFEEFNRCLVPSFALTAVFSPLFQWLCIPFMILSPAVSDFSQTTHLNQTSGNSWIGELKLMDAGKWADEMLLLVRF